jgi:tetratricopeptide (TPR) repeat protein
MSERAAQSGPDQPPTDAVLRLVDAGRADDATAMLATFLAGEPDNVTALGLLSLAHLRARRWDEALRAADAAIGITPDHLPAWQRRSIALIELDRAEEAAVSAAEYLRLGPDLWPAHYTMARVLYPVRGRRQEALRHAEYAVELAPNEADAHNLVGVVQRSLENRTAAERAYRAALAIDPTHALARSNLALLHLGHTGTAEAMAGLREAAANDPQQLSIHRNMALVSVLALVRRSNRLAQATLALSLFASLSLVGVGIGPRLILLGVLVASWALLGSWWWLRLRPYLRSLVPSALSPLMHRSHVRWALAGIAIAAGCAVAALFGWAPELLIIGYTALLGGASLSRTLTARDRRRAALDRSL